MFPIRDHNPSGRTPFVTYLLIAVNVIVFASYYALFDDERALSQFFFQWALTPAKITGGAGVEGFVTSMFLHGGEWHLAGNMLFRFIFGDNVEDEMGHFGYAVFYLACGIAAGLAQFIAEPFSPIPTVGASGAIAGVMGAYLLMFPKARIDIFIFFIVFFKILPIPAWIMLGLWFVMQLTGGFGSALEGGGVAYWAHVGGFVVGLLLAVPLWLRRGGTAYWDRTDGHPPHPEAKYALSKSSIPTVKRRK